MCHYLFLKVPAFHISHFFSFVFDGMVGVKAEMEYEVMNW